MPSMNIIPMTASAIRGEGPPPFAGSFEPKQDSEQAAYEFELATCGIRHLLLAVSGTFSSSPWVTAPL